MNKNLAKDHATSSANWQKPKLLHVITWCLWDAGGASVNAVATTFVFSVYLTSRGFGNQTVSSQAVSIAMTVAGIIVALTAPISGQRADRRGKGTYWLGIFSLIVILCLAAMVFVAPSPSYLWLGVSLLAIMTMFFEFATVNYYAMLPRVSTRETVGRVSGIGWASGYFGGIILLMFLNYGFISENNFFGIDTSNGMGPRWAMLVAAGWSTILFVPLLLTVKGRRAADFVDEGRVSIWQSYKDLWFTIVSLAKKSPSILYFLFASAVFRDGLTGVFTFGGIIAAVTFGFTPGEVIIFAVAANVIAGVSTTALGFLDDKIGPKKVMLVSLTALVLDCLIIFVLHDYGKIVMWTAGLFLTIWVGPAQSASRTFLTRRIPDGNEGEIFGLYQTTGRSVTWLAPLMFSVFISIGSNYTPYYGQTIVSTATASGGGILPLHEQSQYWGILGIALVLLAGLLLLLPVKDKVVHIEHISHGNGRAGKQHLDAGLDAKAITASGGSKIIQTRPDDITPNFGVAQRTLGALKRKLKLLGAFGGAASLAFLLSGCADSQGREYAHPSSPEMEQVAEVFKQVKLAQRELNPHSQADSQQLLQQAEHSGNKLQDSTFIVEPAQCKELVKSMFAQRNLRWDTLLATSSDQQASAQIFLAPDDEAATTAVRDIAKLWQEKPECTKLTVSHAQEKSLTETTITKALEPQKNSPKPKTANPNNKQPSKKTTGKTGSTSPEETNNTSAVKGGGFSISQRSTANNKSTVITTFYSTHKNVLLVVSLQDLSKKPAEVTQDLQVYSKQFLTGLEPHFKP